MTELNDKIFGCIAASQIGSAMGAAVEGMHMDDIAQAYGRVETLMPYAHYDKRWKRPAGTTEDGIERQKLICQAIIEKQDRITAQDLYDVAVRVTDLDKMWYMTQPEDLRVIGLMKAGVPAVEVGRLSGWHDLNFNRATQPIGLINACDPAGAVRDVLDIGRLFFGPTDRALAWAGVYDAGIASALCPDATIDSVLQAALDQADEAMQGEILRAVAIARRESDYAAMRSAFYEIYSGRGIPYAACFANETVSKGFAVFVHAQGDARDAVLKGVNFGRDTDCLAATAGGLAGAFSGIGALPDEWVRQVDRATAANPYTNTQCTIAEHAEGIYGALRARVRKMRALADILSE